MLLPLIQRCGVKRNRNSDASKLTKVRKHMKQNICSSGLDSDGLPHLWIIPYSFLSLSAPEAKLVLQLLIELSNFTTHWEIERIINSTLQIRKLRQGEETISWRSHGESETDKSQTSPSNALSIEHCSFPSQNSYQKGDTFQRETIKGTFHHREKLLKFILCWQSQMLFPFVSVIPF